MGQRFLRCASRSRWWRVSLTSEESAASGIRASTAARMVGLSRLSKASNRSAVLSLASLIVSLPLLVIAESLRRNQKSQRPKGFSVRLDFQKLRAVRMVSIASGGDDDQVFKEKAADSELLKSGFDVNEVVRTHVSIVGR